MRKKSEPIRLAMFRADNHGYWYAPFIQKCDPLLLRDNSCVTHYWYSTAYTPKTLKTPFLNGFEIVKIWDPTPQRARSFSETFFGIPRVVEDVREMVEDVDAAFINDCNADGADHLELARPFLERGIPVFVDKPFASTVRDAREMVRLARRHKTPLFSASILLYVPEVVHLQRRFAELSGPIARGVVKGFNFAKREQLNDRGYWDRRLGGITHGLALAQAVFGAGVESVEVIGDLPLEYTLLRYPKGEREVLVLNLDSSYSDVCWVDVYARIQPQSPPVRARLSANPIGGDEFRQGAFRILREFKKMIKTGRPPLDYRHLIETVVLWEAGLESQRTHCRVALKGYWARPRKMTSPRKQPL
jgi:predicted dehydrogenase